MDPDFAQEGATGAGDAEKEVDERGNDNGVYADFYGGEDDDEDTGPPYDEFQRRDSPISVNLGW